MGFRDDVNKVMKNVKVDDELRNEILNQTTREKEKKNIVWRVRKKVAVIALVGVLCIGTIGVTAGEFSKKWDATAAKLFGANGKTQEKLIKEGYADIKETEDKRDEISVEKNGAVVTVKQTLTDKYGIHICLDVKFPDGKEVPGGWSFEDTEILIDGDENMYSFGCCGMVRHEYDISENQSQYWLHYVKSDNVAENVSGKEISLHLENLVGSDYIEEEDEVIAAGEWDFKWRLKSNENVKTINLNGSYTNEVILEDEKSLEQEKSYEIYHLKSLEISPLSLCIKYESEGVGVRAIGGRISEQGEEGYIPVKIAMKSGKIYTIGTTDYNPIGGWGEYRSKRQIILFDTIIDVDNIEYIEVGGIRYDADQLN